MDFIVINWDLCQICETCPPTTVCRTHAIFRFDPDSPPIVDSSRCNRCGKCSPICNHHAIIINNGFIPNNAGLPAK